MVKVLATCPECGNPTSKAQIRKRGMCAPCWWEVENEKGSYSKA